MPSMPLEQRPLNRVTFSWQARQRMLFQGAVHTTISSDEYCRTKLEMKSSNSGSRAAPTAPITTELLQEDFTVEGVEAKRIVS